MSAASVKGKAPFRQQSSDNNSVSSSEWDMANDVFVTDFSDASPGDGVAARDAALSGLYHSLDRGLVCGLDGHLPLDARELEDQMAQDVMMLGLSAEEYSQSSAFLDHDLSMEEFSESEEGVSRRRVRSNSSRPRGEIVTDLGPEEVRWFYKEDKRTWKPFVGHDSLKIELLFRRVCEQNSHKMKQSGSDGGQGVCGAEEDSVVEAVCVRGGLYEVDIREKECYPVYWNQQDRIPVMRGQWFTDGTWQPLEEEDSDQIEQLHLHRFRGQPMDTSETESASTVVDSKDAIHSEKLSRSHVDWHSVSKVYMYSDATTSKIARTITQKIGFSKASSSGTPLHRGYVEEAAPEDTQPETTHLVFVVHGIGQKMDQGRIIRNTSMMRDAARKMEEKHFPNRTTEHVEFLPVEWRSKLSLDGDTVDSITPDKVRGLRDMLNSSAMDIMYYTSPLYRDEITRGLTVELNRLYSLFCWRNPDFEKNGKVSIVSHSLGCVITFDILTGWDPVRFHYEEAPDYEEMTANCVSEEERLLQEQLRITHLRLRDLENQFQSLQTSPSVGVPALKFKVENFFCMGSPLAVFLALRGIRPGSSGHQDHILPTSICKRLFNIFHPTDPVAYRLEPLILKHYTNIAPVQIHWYNSSNPTLYDQMRPTMLNLVKESTPLSDTESTPRLPTSPPQSSRYYGESITNLGKASIMGAASLGKGISGILFWHFSRSSGQGGGGDEVPPDYECGEEGEGTGLAESEENCPMAPPTSAELDPTSVDLERRIDFELPEGLVESRYWSAVTSHTAYWCSYNVALFLLSFMYRPQEPTEDVPEPEPRNC